MPSPINLTQTGNIVVGAVIVPPPVGTGGTIVPTIQTTKDGSAKQLFVSAILLLCLLVITV